MLNFRLCCKFVCKISICASWQYGSFAVFTNTRQLWSRPMSRVFTRHRRAKAFLSIDDVQTCVNCFRLGLMMIVLRLDGFRSIDGGVGGGSGGGCCGGCCLPSLLLANLMYPSTPRFGDSGWQ